MSYIPSWERIHPLIIHFPIVLLLFAPVLAFVALFFKKIRFGLLVATFILILVGSFTSYLAVSSGRAAEDEVKMSPAAQEVFEVHEALGIKTRNIFTLVTLLFGLSLVAGVWNKSDLAQGASIALAVATIAAFGWGAVTLTETGHRGAMLVHDYGVHSSITPGFIDPTVQSDSREKGESDNDDDSHKANYENDNDNDGD